MGKLFTITDKIRNIARDGLDDLIDQLGKDCRLIYPSVQSDCPNCIYDPITNRSTGRYKSGGPIPFPNGTICPVCRGVGKLASESTETVRLLCKINPRELRQYQLLPGNIQTPNIFLRTKGYLSDLPKILMARQIIVAIEIEGTLRQKFDLFGEPADTSNIIQGRYFTCYWKRTGSA